MGGVGLVPTSLVPTKFRQPPQPYSNQGGADYAHHILMSPPSFESHRRAWSPLKGSNETGSTFIGLINCITFNVFTFKKIVELSEWFIQNQTVKLKFWLVKKIRNNYSYFVVCQPSGCDTMDRYSIPESQIYDPPPWPLDYNFISPCFETFTHEWSNLSK